MKVSYCSIYRLTAVGSVGSYDINEALAVIYV